ncbi:zeta toxin family protein [Aggregatibacter actinomycetemcomitans]|uniref:zeta toxin family protein n=1 Tax=Aggregatibacter actinomycetemcomitans TaxID=714 RepID=UPI00077EB19A|nr:zeta toxin family protein [Aggregatibacter actinomycetemcomitans]
MAKDIQPTIESIEKIFREEYQDRALSSVDTPMVIFVTGVSGSGKSTMIKNINGFLPNRFRIQPDNYRKLHPKLNQYIKELGRDHAHKKTGNFSHRFARGLLDISIEKRVNVIYESTFGNIETARSLIEPFKNAGYTVLVIQLPVYMRLSIERNLRRYEEKKEDMHTLPPDGCKRRYRKNGE